MIEFAAVVLAAGSGSRFASDRNKLQETLAGIPVWLHSVRTFLSMPACAWIGLVVDAALIEEWQQRLEKFGIKGKVSLISGGASRQESSFNGVKAVPDIITLVAIHDAARPFLTSSLIEHLIRDAKLYGAAIPALQITDTLKLGGLSSIVQGPLSRESIAAVQTPQYFAKEIIIKAHEHAFKTNFIGTDEASLVENIGLPVYLSPGEKSNIKITTQHDLKIAKLMIEEKSAVETRTGIGYDIHAFKEGRKLFLGGIEIEHSKGLNGHSDADVIIHAVCDALLGACGMNDIGSLFPNTDEKLLGISSLKLLEEVSSRVKMAGWRIVNIDISVAAEEPKLAPYTDQMKDKMSKAMKIEAQRIGLKATTNEKLGSIGRSEGIAAFAVATAARP